MGSNPILSASYILNYEYSYEGDESPSFLFACNPILTSDV